MKRLVTIGILCFLQLLCTRHPSSFGCDAFQFILNAHTKRCFREDVPFGMKAVFTYTIAQGSGAMPVNVRVTDGLDHEVQARAEADHGVITFQVPSSVPDELSHDDHDESESASERLFRLFPDAVGDNRLPYLFCFEHPRWLHLPHLTSSSVPKRRIIFSVAYGVHAKGKEFYDELAKEKHLSNTEELFRVVEDRVTDIVRLVDEMRQRETLMGDLTQRTTLTVSLYSAFACLAISVGALYTSYWTVQFLAKDKRRIR